MMKPTRKSPPKNGSAPKKTVAKKPTIDTKKIEYVVTTVHRRLKPGAGQRIIYLEQDTP